jgi:hypothetical protein
VPTSLQFFSHLRWIDGRPLLDTIEPYRREIFTRALDAHRDDGTPEINFVLAGRGKKNYKTADLVLAGLYVLLIRDNIQGTDGFILANDEQQANDDLSLAKKLVACNPDLSAELQPLAKEIRRRDGRGSLQILPAHAVWLASSKSKRLTAEMFSRENISRFMRPGSAGFPGGGRPPVTVAHLRVGR